MYFVQLSTAQKKAIRSEQKECKTCEEEVKTRKGKGQSGKLVRKW
jgi:formylmethanofuran dehydrogenase subunit E